MTVMPFPETRVRQWPRSNGAVCRAMPIWNPVILNAWAIQISATVVRFRGIVRSRRSGSMPLIEGESWPSKHLVPVAYVFFFILAQYSIMLLAMMGTSSFLLFAPNRMSKSASSYLRTISFRLFTRYHTGKVNLSRRTCQTARIKESESLEADSVPKKCFLLGSQMDPSPYWDISSQSYVSPSHNCVSFALQNSAGWIVLRVPHGGGRESAVWPIKEKTTIFISSLTNNLLYPNSVLN